MNDQTDFTVFRRYPLKIQKKIDDYSPIFLQKLKV